MVSRRRYPPEVASSASSEPLLRPAAARDAAALADLSRRAIEHGLRWRWTPQRLAAAIGEPETEVVAARAGAAPCGFAVMEYAFAERRAHLVLLAVEPAWRRRGVGRALYRWVETLARAGGVLELGLEVRERNREARAFYASLGFREIALARRYYDGREDALRLHKRLALRL